MGNVEATRRSVEEAQSRSKPNRVGNDDLAGGGIRREHA
jgi:hypothetical protein